MSFLSGLKRLLGVADKAELPEVMTYESRPTYTETDDAMLLGSLVDLNAELSFIIEQRCETVERKFIARLYDICYHICRRYAFVCKDELLYWLDCALRGDSVYDVALQDARFVVDSLVHRIEAEEVDADNISYLLRIANAAGSNVPAGKSDVIRVSVEEPSKPDTCQSMG